MSDRKIIFVFNDAELSCPMLTRKVRELASAVATIERLSPTMWHEFLANQLRDLDVLIYDAVGQPTKLSTEVFEASDEDIDVGNGERVRLRIAEWFERICEPIPAHITPYVPKESRERFRVLATLLIASYPDQTASWPRMVPANDNWIVERGEPESSLRLR